MSVRKCLKFLWSSTICGLMKGKLFTKQQNFAWSKFKAYADNKVKVAKMAEFVLDRVENNVGKGENADYQHFLLFPPCFEKASFPGLLEPGIVW